MPIGKSTRLRFADRRLLPNIYRFAFLRFIETEAPEVWESLKELCPKWSAVIKDFLTTDTLISLLDGRSANPDVTRREILDSHLNFWARNHIKDVSLLPIAEEDAWRSFSDLRASYSGFIDKYGLNTNWLRQDLFGLLRILNLNPQSSASLCHTYSTGWLRDLIPLFDILEERPKDFAVACLVRAREWFPAEMENLSIETDGWYAGESWGEFELRAKAEFELQLSSHKTEAMELFGYLGYNKITKPLDFTPVKWLVWWSVLGMSKPQILERIDTEKADAEYDQKSLEYHFRQLKKYDLPVRLG